MKFLSTLLIVVAAACISVQAQADKPAQADQPAQAPQADKPAQAEQPPQSQQLEDLLTPKNDVTSSAYTCIRLADVLSNEDQLLIKRLKKTADCQALITYLNTSLPIALKDYGLLQETVKKDTSGKLKLDVDAEAFFKQLTEASANLKAAAGSADSFTLVNEIFNIAEKLKGRLSAAYNDDALLTAMSRVFLSLAFIDVTESSYTELECSKPASQTTP